MDVKTDVVSFLTSLDVSDVLPIIADRVIDDQKLRISLGIGSNGLAMDTRSVERVGRYSKDYAKGKANTSVRDLRMTGEMIDEYGIMNRGFNYVEIGFNSALMADRAEYNEAYMGQAAFDASAGEVELIGNTFDELFEKKFI